jgi:hypothetical protein
MEVIMDLPEHSPRLELDPFEGKAGVFDSTLKGFDLHALNLKRGFRVNQTLNGLRTLAQLTQELQSRTTSSYAAIRYRAEPQPE